MKKIIIAVAVGVFGILSVQAQEIDFGVKVGANFAKLTGDNLEDADGRTGIHVGLTGEYMFGESFGLQVEAVYSQQGLQRDERTVLGIVFPEEKVKLDYINVPVLAKFYIAQSGFSIEAGPQVGFLVSDKREVDGVESELNAETIDLSAGGGLAYKFKEDSTLEGLSLSARYMIGLSNVNKDNQTFGDDVTNSVLQFSIGYKF